MSIRPSSIAIFVILSCALGLPAAAETRIERDFALAAGGTFRLDSVSGSVEVVGTSGDRAHVRITSREDDLEERYDVSFEESDGGLAVIVRGKGRERSSWFRWNSGPGLRFEIRLPRRVALDIDTAGGGIDVDSIEGDVRLDTSGGGIEVRDVRGKVLADTSGGAIVVERVEGDVVADTSGGSISVEDVSGSVRADTSGGGIQLRQVAGDAVAETSGGGIRIEDAGGSVRADTSGGPIRVSFAAGNDRGGSLSTSGGGITVELDPTVGLRIDASTSGGSVVSDVPVSVAGRVSRTSLVGNLGSGGETLRVRVSGGSVRIESR